MSMNQVVSKSFSVTGSAPQTLEQIETFLSGLRESHASTDRDFQLVHALVFPKSLQEEQRKDFNGQLGRVYEKCGFQVLGGDTSSGQELSVFISAIVF